jgi:hypothetical protein
VLVDLSGEATVVVSEHAKVRFSRCCCCSLGATGRAAVF